MDEDGRFTDAGYIRSTGDSWNRYFDGSLDDIPDEYRITGSGEALEKDEKLLAVVVEPGKQAEFRDIDSGLEALQGLVGGDIQAIYPMMTRWQLSAMRKANSKVSRSTAPCVTKVERSMILLSDICDCWFDR
jgi:hypothetical protein